MERAGARSCGGGPPSPSSVPWAGWSASRRASCAGWSGSPMPRWPSSNGAGRSTSTPSSAWTRPPTAAVLAAWPHHPSRSPPACSRTPSGRQSRPSGCPARPGRRRAGPVCPLGRAARRPQHHPRRRPGGGAVGRAGGRLHRQVRHQGHRELRRRPRPPHRRRRPGPPRQAAGACGRARPGVLGAGWPPRAGRAPVAGVGAHARVRRPLVDQEPPLLHHHERPAPGPGRLRQAPPGPRRRSPGRLRAGPRTTRP